MTPVGKAKPKVESELPSDDDVNLEKQIRATVKHAIQLEQQGQGAKAQRPKKGGAN